MDDKKHQGVTLCATVDFYPELNQLVNKNSGKVVGLNWPTARCLSILIEHYGEVVPQEYFIEHVWSVKNIVVSNNTFVQNISLLRRSLRSVGIDSDVIVTIKGRGYIIPLTFSIENFDITTNDWRTSSLSPTPEHCVEEPRSIEERPLSEDKERLHQPLQLFWCICSGITIAAAILLLFLSVYLYYFPYKKIEYVFFNQDKDGCKFYFDREREGASNIIDKVKRVDVIDCQKKSEIYITAYEEVPHYTVIQCRYAIEDKIRNNVCSSAVHFSNESD
ncbi:hypothetical protein PMPD1_3445 [Paramixta manurensis]|uniref:OmpR/PhoB-type domain-containing protein n=1 Tax=Paramixta manurensis TaxID=2740817 RepID=A0A6M8UN59_9GAMM|nr:hypothetical protein PMPD1_3445 [Erwiniaceae bacterium PD-1]